MLIICLDATLTKVELSSNSQQSDTKRARIKTERKRVTEPERQTKKSIELYGIM